MYERYLTERYVMCWKAEAGGDFASHTENLRKAPHTSFKSALMRRNSGIKLNRLTFADVVQYIRAVTELRVPQSPATAQGPAPNDFICVFTLSVACSRSPASFSLLLSRPSPSRATNPP